MSDLNLLYTDVEDDLRSSVRDLVAARSESATVAAVYDGDRSVVDPLWRAIAGDLGLTMAQLAVAWVLANDNVACAIVGASRPEQVTANAAASGVS